MHTAIIVADDLTGAMDTAHGFAARGYGTAVLALPEADRDAGPDTSEPPVLSINTESRYMDREAAAAVADAVSVFPAEVVYKKVDSTLRGNVGSEVNAALTALDVDFALVAPAFPAAGRTTEGGIHYVDGTPVAETEYGEDQKGPTSSSITDCFATVDRPVKSTHLSIIEAGPDSVMSVFRDAIDHHNRTPIVVCDANTDDHLETITDAASEFDALYVGSGALAEHVTVSDDATDAYTRTERSDGVPLGVVGSVSETTLSQLERIPDKAVFELDSVAILLGEDNDETVRCAVKRLRAGRPAVLTAATDREAVKRTRTAGNEHGLSPDEIRECVASGLGEAAIHTVHAAEPSGLFLTGGDVAIAVMRALGATTIRLSGESVDAGIPIGHFVDGAAAGTPVVTKAGGFGTDVTIINCLETFLQDDE